ncbi:MAG: hypothetical protein ACOYKN_08730 [Pirellula sp.]|jgi:type II secretory pathway pseudopilin PulG
MNKRRPDRTALRNGITLTEVVIGIALLGTLLCVMLIAAGRLERQRKLARAKIEAIETIDQFAQKCFREGFPPRSFETNIDRHPSWRMTYIRMQLEDLPENISKARIAIDVPNDELQTSLVLAAIEVLVSNEYIQRSPP